MTLGCYALYCIGMGLFHFGDPGDAAESLNRVRALEPRARARRGRAALAQRGPRVWLTRFVCVCACAPAPPPPHSDARSRRT